MEKSEKIISSLNRIENRLSSTKTILTVPELAEYTKLSVSFIYKLTSKSKIPHYKPGGKIIYFNREEVDQWLMHIRVKPESELI